MKVLKFEDWNRSMITEAGKKPKPSDVIVKSLMESPKGKGLVALGAEVKTQGQERVTLQGRGRSISAVINTPEHPDNPFNGWWLYYPSPRGPYKSTEFDSLDDIWQHLWNKTLKNSLPPVPGLLMADTPAKLDELGVKIEDALPYGEIKDRFLAQGDDNQVDLNAILSDPRIQRFIDSRFGYRTDKGVGALKLRIAFPEGPINQAFRDLFPPLAFDSVALMPSGLSFILTADPKAKRSELVRGLGESDYILKGDTETLINGMVKGINEKFAGLEIDLWRIWKLEYPNNQDVDLAVIMLKSTGIMTELIPSNKFIGKVMTEKFTSLDPAEVSKFVDSPQFKEWLKSVYLSGPDGALLYNFIDPQSRKVEVQIDPKNMEPYMKTLASALDDEEKSEKIVEFFTILPEAVKNQLIGNNQDFERLIRAKRRFL